MLASITIFILTLDPARYLAFSKAGFLSTYRLLPRLFTSKADEYEKLGSYAMIGLPGVYEKRFGET